MNLKDKTLLYIEDEPISRAILTRRFQNIFGKVLLAHDGEDGLNMLDKSPDIIISDNLMPNLSGIKMAHILRSRGIDIPIILTTASDHGIDIEGIKNIYVIAKPIHLQSLETIISESLKDATCD